MAVRFFGRGSQFWRDRASRQIEPHLTKLHRLQVWVALWPLSIDAESSHLAQQSLLVQRPCDRMWFRTTEVMITGGMKCIREARSGWDCLVYWEMMDPETGFFLPLVLIDNMTIFNSFISLKLHFAAIPLDFLCCFVSIQSLLTDSKCHLSFSSLVVLFCRPAFLEPGFSNTLWLA